MWVKAGLTKMILESVLPSGLSPTAAITTMSLTRSMIGLNSRCTDFGDLDAIRDLPLVQTNRYGRDAENLPKIFKSTGILVPRGGENADFLEDAGLDLAMRGHN